MSEIKVLDDNVISKIAAGEIISRPLNIVKELIENSLDSGADNIIISIDKNKISVEDNGCGIGKAYIELAFLRHSTSKINSEHDLENISSLGFRGEALYAISVVSEVDLYTKTKDEDAGTHFKIKAAEPVLKEDTAKNKGTKIIISELFFNLPARKKHLKNFDYELRQITSLIEQLAIINCDISFSLKINNTTKLFTWGNSNLKETIYEIYGKDFTSKLIDFKYEQSPLYASGYLCDLGAKSRGIKIISVNKRLVSSKTIYAAAKQAYEELIGQGEGAGDYILNITLPYNMVDVNVHPSKEEVRFANETLIFMLIKNAVKEALSSMKINPVLNKLFLNLDDEKQDAEEPIQEKFANFNSYKSTQAMAYITDIEEVTEDDADMAVQYNTEKLISYEYIQKPSYEAIVNDEELYETSSSGIDKNELKTLTSLKISGHIFNRYIMLQGKDCVYLIDQHAAHERIIYELLMADLLKDSAKRQILLAPEEILLSASDLLLARENADILDKIGFEISFLSGGIKVLTVPIIASEPQNTQMLITIIDGIKNDDVNVVKDRNDYIIKKACKAAVKSGRVLNDMEIRRLLTDLIKTKTPFICPHGRDIIVKMKKTFIDSLFGR